MDEIQPIRFWRLSPRLKEQVDERRKILKRGLQEYGLSDSGVLTFEDRVSITPSMIRSFEDIQGAIFKDGEFKRFLDQFINFWDGSRQVFSMERQLCEQLSQTDIADVPWDELRLPHEEFFLSFGDYGQDSFAIRDFQYIVDGVYIKRVDQRSVGFPNDTILLQFTSRLLKPSYEEARALRGTHFAEPVYEFCVSGKGCATIGDAMARGEAEYRIYCNRLDEMGYVLAQEFLTDFPFPLGRKMNFTELKFDRGKQVILAALPVLFNSIFYLCQKPEARIEGFPLSAPSALLHQWKSTTTPSVKRIFENRLAEKGFSKIYFVRDPDLQPDTTIPDGNRIVRAHWRRGHWRNQPFGKGAMERRWRWIKPVLVKKDEPLTLGTIQVVKNQDDERC